MTDITTDIEENKQISEDELYKTAPIGELFCKVVVPSIIAMILMGIQGLVDGLFLGNFIGANAMASANIAAPVLQIITAFAMVVGIGGTAFIGRTLGENDLDKARDIFKSCFIAEVVFSIIFVIICVFFNRQLASLFGANEVLIAGTSDYIKTISLTTPFIMLYMLFSFTNRIIGKPHLFLISSIVSIFANIIFNYLFIVLLQLELVGAALATGLSFTIGFFINLAPMISKKTNINIYEGKFDWNLLKKSMYNGSSEGVTGIATGVTVLVFNLTFMHFYGETGVSAFTIINYIATFATLSMFGMADGVTPIISYNYGAGQFDRIKKIMKISIIGNTIIGIIAYSIVIFFGETLIEFFADGNQELIELTYNGGKIYAISFIMAGFSIMVSAYFTALGNALKSMLVSSSRGLIFILVGIFILPNIFGVTGVWLVPPFADFITFFIGIFVLNLKPSNKYNAQEVVEIIDIDNLID